MRSLYSGLPGTSLSVVGAAMLAVSACGSATSEVASGGPDLELGKLVYASSCASCHGQDLRGTDKGPSQLSIVYEPNHHSDDAYRSAIANGAQQHHWNFGPMAAIEGLSAEQVDSVIAYIRSQQASEGFEQ